MPFFTNEALLKAAALDTLDALGAHQRRSRYVALWEAAGKSADARFPCPKCYADGLISPMKIVSAQLPVIDLLECSKCGTELAGR